MKYLRKICMLFSLLFVLSASDIGFMMHCSAAGYEITAEQMTELEMELNALEANNERLLILLDESETELTKAESESTALREQLQTAKEKLLRLRNQLQTLKTESANAEKSLEIANRELQDAAASLKKSADRTKRIERQRNFWEIVAGLVGVVAMAK